MGSTDRIPLLKVVYYDEEKADDVVICGQYEAVLADRKFGEGATGRGNLDAVTYAAFLSMRRAKLLADGTDYETFARTVALTEPAGRGESPAPLET